MKLLPVKKMKRSFCASTFQDQIDVMRLKESSVYRVPDSCYTNNYRREQDEHVNEPQECQFQFDREIARNPTASDDVTASAMMNDHASIVSTDSASEPGFEIDDTCRYQMVDWSYRIIDFFSASREIVGVAFNYMDRLFDMYSCDSALNYKLACITSIYIALKVYNRKTIRTATLSELSQGEITPNDITDMECIILKALSYNLCPPTSWAFVGVIHNLVSNVLTKNGASENVQDYVMQRAYYFSEIAVMNNFCVGMPQSTIAFASILNALGELECLSYAEALIVEIEKCLQTSRASWGVRTSRQVLWTVFRKHSSILEHLHDAEIIKEEVLALKQKEHTHSMTKNMGIAENHVQVESPLCISQI